MTNYATEKELEDTAGADRLNLAAKRDFIALNVEFGKLDTKFLIHLL